MSSETEICNTGIIEYLGEEPIASIDDDESKTARMCKAIFGEKRDYLLRVHPWTFSQHRVALAPTTDTPPWDWEYYFEKPHDFLRVWEFQKEGVLYKIEGDYILANDDTQYFVYGRQVTDPNKMDPLFRACLGALLAKTICLAITGSYEKYRAAKGGYESLLDQARMVDSMEDATETVQAEDWLNSRF